MSKSKIRTKFNKGPLIFTIVGFLISILIVALMIVFRDRDSFTVVACVFMGIIAIASAILLFVELRDYAYIVDDNLVMVYLFKKRMIKIVDIGLMSLKDNVYTVFDRKNEKIGTINALLDGIDLLVVTLDKKGVKIV